ncbi:MAG: hypothetical protein IJ873_06865 [Lachnospiraceae bacterium]|nr:hypothetical protein [Lachnospiraceae bacterium]
MLETARAYYDGSAIIVDEAAKKMLSQGQELLITYVVQPQQSQSKAEKRRAFLASGRGVIPSGRSAEEIDREIREARDNDRA